MGPETRGEKLGIKMGKTMVKNMENRVDICAGVEDNSSYFDFVGD